MRSGVESEYEFPGRSSGYQSGYKNRVQGRVKVFHAIRAVEMANEPSIHDRGLDEHEGDAASSDDHRVERSVDAYLSRISIDPATVDEPDLETLEELQRAHVTSVPFENLSIVGDPYGEWAGERVVLDTSWLYEKIVDRGRGGYCFELNGLFHWLLDELGYDVDRVAARVTSDDGTARPPANHHANVVELDRRYVVEVGTGVPMLRQPLPLDGSSRIDEVGVEWRVAESDRPDETYCTEYRRSGGEWSTRYVFSDVPRALWYFTATNDYLQSAPESGFTDGPMVAIATADGHRKLSAETLTAYVGGDEREHRVTEAEWHAVLEREFGLSLGSGADVPGE